MRQGEIKMAKAELQYKTHTRKVSRTVVETEEVQKVSGITLTLTKQEARTLRTILRCVAGPVDESLRGVTDNIEEALKATGVGFFRRNEVFAGAYPSLYFTVGSKTAAVSKELFLESSRIVSQKRPLKVGDRVRVVRKVESNSDGWNNTWEAPEMDQYINNGRVYTIARISDMGVRFEEDDGYGWPVSALELAH